MKKYLTDNLSAINISLGIIFVVIMLILMFMSYVINDENYKKIAKLYEEKFGRLPVTASLARSASLIGTPGMYFAKVDFIMSSLIFPYNKVFNNDMSIEAYHFIRSLPKDLTLGFKIEAAFWFIEFIVMACLVLLYYLF
ncbi:hypothetical protein DLR11_25200 [Salmonella enterica subsp. salamae]|uniref:Uncharacterized protein n=1 Tax=Salmonella enterica subsp. salamae TaxID=59202 RepID=A0A5Y3V0X2_SALER|nr:hypothetical protein [Salmonella enterica subsp. salamae]EEO2384125.1 hypothetical protein [Salmonella enterica]ECG8515445.1 hypothetical protein [Salmonella enterica subsp. salamae]ECI3455028.1 hypothetical protein [Salmonella enterica subsp. salamae]ECI4078886.1 hypothetical protein [Salmonella enterica subsp. salamae]